MNKRLLSCEERVQSASTEAYQLALDALHDSALQEALFRRLDNELQSLDGSNTHDLSESASGRNRHASR